MGIWLVGCGAKQYYTLSSPHEIKKVQSDIESVIGVESIELPQYMTEGKVAILGKENQIYYLDNAIWAVNMQEDLTNALIFDLQKRLPKSHIFHYPWEGREDIDFIVRIKITHFIAYNGVVYLDAVVRVNDRDKIVSVQEPADMKDAAKIVASMKRAFVALEREVIRLLDDIEVLKKQR